MKRIITIPFYLLVLAMTVSTAVRAQHKDGPYVFYKHDTIAVRSVVLKDGHPTMSEQLITGNNGQPIHISVPGSDTIGTGFDVELVKPEKQPSTYDKPEKMFVISDIEGEFLPFKTMLIANGVMDGNYAWTFGKGHLIICGDLFDRGLQVVEYLWLLYKLEQAAKASGGYVHVILGNHDIMNLSGDFRYVMPKYFETAAAFGIDYKTMYDENTELGRWLRTKNIAEKIGDMLFLHAGISADVNNTGFSVQALNDSSRPYYAVHIDSIPDRVFRYFGSDNSPFWYRGYFKTPRASLGQVDSTLALFNVKKIVVGHTILTDITELYGGKVIGIDVNEHAGNAQALLIEDDKFYRVGTKGERQKMVVEKQ